MRKVHDRPRSGGRSRSRLLDATIQLLDARDAASVTVTDVVTTAGVTRPTFYAAFDALPTAFADAALSRLEHAFEGMTLDTDIPEEERAPAMEAAFLSILSRLQEHTPFFRRVLRSPGGSQVHERIVSFLAERLREDSPVSPTLARGPLPVEVASSALAAGVTWTILTWLDDESRLTIDALAEQLRDFILHAIVGGLGGAENDTRTDKGHQP
jgi:AcrR family transcriptional regulator